MSVTEFLLEICFHVIFMVVALSTLYFVVISPLSETMIKDQLDHTFGTGDGLFMFNRSGDVTKGLEQLILYLEQVSYTNNPAAEKGARLTDPRINAVIISIVSCGLAILGGGLLIYFKNPPILWPVISSAVVVTACLITDIIIIKTLVSNIQYVDIGSLFNIGIENPLITCKSDYTTILNTLAWRHRDYRGNYPKFA